LIPYCEHVEKLNAICHSCCDDAAFTKRTTTEKVVEVIGGADKYVAACRQCHGKMHLLPEVEKYRSQIVD
jgi:thymidine kinase